MIKNTFCISLLISVALLYPVSATEHGPVVERFPAMSLIELLDGELAAFNPSDELLDMPPAALSLVKHFEGWFPKAYDDPAGYCTIGYGHLLAKAKCSTLDLGEFADPISEQRGEQILSDDTVVARHAVLRLVNVELNDAQFGALGSFVFNVGVGNFSRSTLLEVLNLGEYDKASREFRRWVKAGGVTLPGLQIRRACETALFLGSLVVVEGEVFDRTGCMDYAAAPASGDLIDLDVGE